MIRKRLKQLRKAHRYTQKQIGEILNCQQSCYGKYERGDLNIPIDAVITLCKFYKVKISELIKEDN